VPPVDELADVLDVEPAVEELALAVADVEPVAVEELELAVAVVDVVLVDVVEPLAVEPVDAALAWLDVMDVVEPAAPPVPAPLDAVFPPPEHEHSTIVAAGPRRHHRLLMRVSLSGRTGRGNAIPSLRAQRPPGYRRWRRPPTPSS
jgi:hypothetical protein